MESSEDSIGHAYSGTHLLGALPSWRGVHASSSVGLGQTVTPDDLPDGPENENPEPRYLSRAWCEKYPNHPDAVFCLPNDDIDIGDGGPEPRPDDPPKGPTPEKELPPKKPKPPVTDPPIVDTPRPDGPVGRPTGPQRPSDDVPGPPSDGPVGSPPSGGGGTVSCGTRELTVWLDEGVVPPPRREGPQRHHPSIFFPDKMVADDEDVLRQWALNIVRPFINADCLNATDLEFEPLSKPKPGLCEYVFVPGIGCTIYGLRVTYVCCE